MKIKIVAGFVSGVVLTSTLMLSMNVKAIIQNPIPVITSIAPNSGYTTGGEAVTITGRYLDEVNQVLFGTDSALIQTTSVNALVVIVPAHPAGFVDVTASNLDGSATAVNAYRYITPPPPSVISLTPSSGSVEGGTNVTIAGSFLDNIEMVTFDGLAASIISMGSSQAVVATPTHEAGLIDVIVTTSSGTASILNAYKYIDSTPPPVPMPPSISALDPDEGPIEGGTSVTIFGTNLATVTAVTFDGTEAVMVSANETELAVTTPAHSAGSVNVMIENSDGITTFENGFTYTREANPPAYVYCNWHDNGNNWKENKKKGNKKKKNHKKALVCHAQSKPKNTFKTLCLPLEAIPAYLAHGDESGYCKNDNPNASKDDDRNDSGKRQNKGDDKNKKSSWKFWKKR